MTVFTIVPGHIAVSEAGGPAAAPSFKPWLVLGQCLVLRSLTGMAVPAGSSSSAGGKALSCTANATGA